MRSNDRKQRNTIPIGFEIKVKKKKITIVVTQIKHKIIIIKQNHYSFTEHPTITLKQYVPRM